MPQWAKLRVWAQVRHRGGPPPYGHKTGRSGGVNPKGSHDSGLKPAMAHLPPSPAEGYKKLTPLRVREIAGPDPFEPWTQLVRVSAFFYVSFTA